MQELIPKYATLIFDTVSRMRHLISEEKTKETQDPEYMVSQTLIETLK